MSDYHINLNDPATAYMFGFLQADGHLYANSRNRGRLTLELNTSDKWILEQFASLIPFYSSIKTRTRTTNFQEAYSSVVWSVHNQSFRDALICRGFLTGRKSDRVAAPNGEYSEIDYFRGMVDADGSVGKTANGFPFLSIVTSSDEFASHYNAFLRERVGCRKKIERNKRDNIFNITVFKEEAQTLAAILYYDGCLALPRKYAKTLEVAQWERPANMKKMNRRVWCGEQDAYILTHSVEEAAHFLERTEQSIKMRLWRIVGKEVTK